MRAMRVALKRTLQQWVPAPVLRRALTLRSRWLARRQRAASLHQVFTNIYRNNHWGSAESVSGPGSEVAATRAISAALPGLLRKYEIRSMLDVPCGDFHWMKDVDLGDVDYVGGDIVEDLVAAVSRRHGAANRRFMVLDVATSALPPVDLIFCRDCFIHLPFSSIHAALANFRRSQARYVLLTTYLDWPINYDTSAGGARGVDLCAWPFNLPKPIELIEEARSGSARRCMGLWATQHL